MDLCWQSNVSLLFNMLSRLVIGFLPRSKCLLISWLQSPSAVILEPPKVKSVTVSIVSPSICHEVAMKFFFFFRKYQITSLAHHTCYWTAHPQGLTAHLFLLTSLPSHPGSSPKSQPLRTSLVNLIPRSCSSPHV